MTGKTATFGRKIMTMPAVEERVDRLEEAIDSFVASVGAELNKL
ncbi:MAG: hypothetical protein P8Y27_13130 [Chromatiaceae bacterium]|jgi:hypothetical protein